MDTLERNALSMQWHRLACKTALHLYNTQPLIRLLGTADDILQQATLVSLRAAELYDSKHASGAKFSTFLVQSIRNVLLREAYEDALIGVPNHLIPSLRGKKAPHRYTGLAFKALFYRQGLPRDYAGVPEEEPERDDLTRADQFEQLRDAVSRLDPEDRQLLSSHYGLGGVPAKNYREMGREAGRTGTRMQQKVKRALGRLKRELEVDLAQSTYSPAPAAGTVPGACPDRPDCRRAGR